MIKKLFTSFLIIVLIVQIVSPVLVFAEEITPTPAPGEASVENSSTTENTASSSSDTGSNSIGVTPAPQPEVSEQPVDITVSPTPIPDAALTSETGPTPTPIDTQSESTDFISPTPAPDTTASNSAEILNTGTTTSNTGSNSVDSADSASSPQAGSPQVDSTTASATTSTSSGDSSQNISSTSAEIKTGDAVSVAEVDNEVNTTSINSDVVIQTINLFVDKNGTLDLSNSNELVNKVITAKQNDPVINVLVKNIDNYSYLSNDVVAYANTGNNQIDGAADAVITTGNAYSIVSLINKVNFTIVNSKLHLVTINVFADFEGDILLPDYPIGGSGCTDCSSTTQTNSSASVSNNSSSAAVSGGNTVEGSGSITSGDAESIANIINILNANFVNVNGQILYINNLGTWEGDFLGWGELDPQTGGASMVISQTNANPEGEEACISCSGDLNVSNQAEVSNNVSSAANTGGNTINGNGKIVTGKAFSAISIFNFINSSFVNSDWTITVINIFKRWKGDIGDKKAFAKENTEDKEKSTDGLPDEKTESENNSNPEREKGGLLSVGTSNNTGEYVLPGDTVTFFVEVKNPGSGVVYDSHLKLNLIKDGENVGGASFDLGNIGIGKGIKLSTGLVLSDKIKGGEYIAQAEVTGTVGEDQTVSASADSAFKVFVESLNIAKVADAAVNDGAKDVDTNNKKNKPEVLGNVYKNDPKKDIDLKYLFLLLFTTTSYVSVRVVKKRDSLVKVFGKEESLRSKLKTLRMILL